MKPSDFTFTFSVEQNEHDVFTAICDVQAWWSEDFHGSSRQQNDVFDVRFEEVHFSVQKLTEVIPDKRMVWLVTESRLNFLRDKSEWTGTTISFDISRTGDKTNVVFIHHGLVPSIECFKDCSSGWTHFLNGSLLPLITTGKGNPNVLEKEVRAKRIAD